MASKLLRRLFGPIKRKIDSPTIQQRAEWKMGRIERGLKIPAPRYPVEEKTSKEAQKDKQLKKSMETKHEKLAKNLDQVAVTSTDPSSAEPSKPARQLPTRATEVEHPGGVFGYEYGFYEPPEEKMEPNRLTFREALDFLRHRMEIEPSDETQEVDEERSQAARVYLDNHPAAKRVSAERLELLWQYYRPFDAHRKREQKVISKQNLNDLLEAIEDYPSQRRLTAAALPGALREKMLKKRQYIPDEEQRLEHIGDEDREQLLDAMEVRRVEEMERLSKRLNDMRQLDTEVRQEAKTKSDETTRGGDDVEGREKKKKKDDAAP